MLTRRTFVTSTLGLVATASLAACGGSGSDDSADTSAGTQTLSIAATPEPHARILTEYAAPLLAEQGIELDVRVFTDYVQPNEVVYNGEIDCNYFQHVNYLNDYNTQNNEDLAVVAKIHYEPYGIYAGKSDDLTNIADGAVVAVPNDTSNEARALLLLQQQGIITLADPNDLGATPNDIVDNPHNIDIREIEAAATPRALEDVDFAAINGNYAQEAGLHASDALALEEANGVAFEEYANIIVTSADKVDDERIAALVAVLTTDEFKAYLQETFGEDVLAAF